MSILFVINYKKINSLNIGEIKEDYQKEIKRFYYILTVWLKVNKRVKIKI